MSKRVLVAPLDWGLGHATRCVPVIQELLNRNCEVLVASNGSALALLKKEFPLLQFLELPSYRIKYPKKGSFVFSIILQIPGINAVIRQEHKRIQHIVQEKKIDLIISDNRYGCWSDEIPSIFICHQLNIQLFSGWRLLKPLVDWLHHQRLKKFTACWVPDDSKLNLTGELSKYNHAGIKRIGILSRLKKKELELKYDLAIVLSGPEPQRSIFEEIISTQIGGLDLKMIMIRGVVEGEGNWKENGNLTMVNFLQSEKLEQIISQSKLVIARSGYSTVMDLAKLGKKAIVVPTPGQTEQEYLGKKLMEERIALSVQQHEFNLKTALSASSGFSGFINIAQENNLLASALDEILK